MNWQDVVAISLVAITVFIVVMRTVRRIRSGTASPCDSCPGSKSAAPPPGHASGRRPLIPVSTLRSTNGRTRAG